MSVRGGDVYKIAEKTVKKADLVDNGDGTVSDRANKIMWVKNDSDEVKKVMQDLKMNKKYLFDLNVLKHIQNIYYSTAVSNEMTLETIKIFKQKFNYLADPHTATGLSVLHNIDLDHAIVSLACAHPAKFGDAIKKATNEEPIFPKELEKIFDKEEKMTILSNNSNEIKSFILKNL